MVPRTSQPPRIKRKNMATQLKCRWCGVLALVPLGVQSLSCPSCGGFTPVLGNYTGFRQAAANGVVNLMSRNPYMINAVRAGPTSYPSMNTGNMYQIPQPLRPPAAHGRKRAFLCGILYKGHKQALNGSINDVMLMKKLLIERMGFPMSSILVLTEEEDRSRIPTKQNIRAAMRWLVQGCQGGDSLVFFYSGHGSQMKDQDGDELDGYDECLLPLDYEFEGKILDDEINATIVRPLPKDAKLHAIIDTCFSGTFLDLTNVCRVTRDGYYKWDDHRVKNAFKGTSGGLAISISACEDHQNSGDTTAFTGAAQGALTYSFVQTMQQEPKLTYGRLLMSMHERIGVARNQVGLNSMESHLKQEPQLSTSHKFDIHTKKFVL